MFKNLYRRVSLKRHPGPCTTSESSSPSSYQTSHPFLLDNFSFLSHIPTILYLSCACCLLAGSMARGEWLVFGGNPEMRVVEGFFSKADRSYGS